MKYKALLMSSLGVIPAALQPAHAADMPVKAPHVTTWTPNWAGWYGGLNLGLIADQSRESAFVPNVSGLGVSNYCWASSTTNCSFQNTQTAVGILGGAQIGYNFQNGSWIYGAEIDFDLTSARKTTNTNYVHAGGIIADQTTQKTGIDALGTARLRLGYAFDRTMVYATGGLAYGHSLNSFKAGANNGYNWSDTGWRTGWTAGGGLEYMLDRKWSLRGEALYYDLGSKSHVSSIPAAAAGLNDRMTGWVARIGLNYFFH